MPAPNGRIFGCNVIDPLLEVRGGTDYSLAITERSLEFLREIGHDAIEYSHACHWSVEECEAVREMTARVDLIPWSLHAWAGGDVMADEGRRSTAAVLNVATRNAQALGVPIIVHHPNGQRLDRDEDHERLRIETELLAGLAAPGVRFALENGVSLPTMEYVIALVDALGPDRAGVCVDTGHAALGDLGPGRALRMARHRLITTHLQDNRGQHDDHMPPGDGCIDWDDVVAALTEIAYPGCVLLELTDQPGDAMRRVTIREELARGAKAARNLAARLPAPRRQ
jgi:sugar phosphate isomerase/epimerase